MNWLTIIFMFTKCFSIAKANEIKLIASDAALMDEFGNSVYIDGDFAIVGANVATTHCQHSVIYSWK